MVEEPQGGRSIGDAAYSARRHPVEKNWRSKAPLAAETEKSDQAPALGFSAMSGLVCRGRGKFPPFADSETFSHASQR